MKDNNYKPYTAKRWTEIPMPVVTEQRHIELTDEQKRRDDAVAEYILKEYGVIKPDETIKNGKVVKKDTTQS